MRLKLTIATVALAAALAGCAAAPSAPAPEPLVGMTPVPVAVVDPDADTDAHTSAMLDAVVREAQPGATAALTSSNGVYSDVQILAVHPDTVEYLFVYAQQVPLTDASSYFDQQLATFQTTFDTQIFPAMISAGFATPKAQITFQNADGSVLWTRTLEPSP